MTLLALSTIPLLACSVTGVTLLGKAADTDLHNWVERELAPYLVDQLSRQPRFKDESVLLIAMDESELRPDIDTLTQSVRTQLMNQLLQAPGAELAWRPNVHPLEHHRKPDQPHCKTASQVRYFVGIDITRVSASKVRVQVRALDITAGNWVTGFGKTWQGRLTREQETAFREKRTDEYLRGLRVLPFYATETDLLAAYVANNIACVLIDRQVLSSQILVDPYVTNQPVLQHILKLVEHNLGRKRSQQSKQTDSGEILLLGASLTQIDGDLHQLWVNASTISDDTELTKIETAAYLSTEPDVPHLSNNDSQTSMPVVPASSDSGTVSQNATILSPLRVLSGLKNGGCELWDYRELSSNGTVAPGACFEIEFDLFEPAHVLVLRHTTSGSLSWIPTADCKLIGNNENWRAAWQKIRIRGLRNDNARWQRSDGNENIYAIALTDTQLAHDITLHAQRLPSSCSVHANDEIGNDHALQWLTELDTLIDRNENRVDWQEVIIRHAAY